MSRQNIQLTNNREMKGIMFTEDLFKQIINGNKTQTRRIFNWDRGCITVDTVGFSCFTPKGKISIRGNTKNGQGEWFEKPRYMKGETIYLKEPYCISCDNHGGMSKKCCYLYATGFDKCTPCNPVWKNKMFMPESAARYFIEITDVNVQRLQDITEEDARNEGVYFAKSPMGNCYLDYINGGCNILVSAYKSFRSLWRKINGNESWELNPWVFIYKFKLINNTKTL